MATFAANLNTFDALLIDKLKSSDQHVFGEIFRHFGQKIFRTALRILREEESAKDAMQETIINIHRAAHTFRGDSRLSTWINRITVNVCLEMIRKNKRHENRTDEDVSEYHWLEDRRQGTPYQEACRAEVAERVHRAFDRLSRKHAVVVRMHDLEGFTIKEIADQLKVAEGTVKSRLFYGREELKRKLAA